MATYAVNNEQLARALGLKPGNRRVLAEIGCWRERPDFPAREYRGKRCMGWRVAEVKAWYRAFLLEAHPPPAAAKDKKPKAPTTAPPPATGDLPAQERPAGDVDMFLSDADKFRLRLEHNKEIYLNPGKHLTPAGSIIKLNSQEVQELRDYGMIPRLHPDEMRRGSGAAGDVVADEESAPLGFAANQAALTEALARNFGQALGIIISENKVSEWLNGRNIPPGATAPPTKLRGRFNVSDWVAWIEQWVRPYYAGAAGTGTGAGQKELDLERQAQLAEARKTIREDNIKAVEEMLALGKALPKDELGAALDTAARTWLNELDRVEHLIPQGLDAELKTLAVDDDLRLNVMAKVRTLCAAFNDALRQTLREQLEKLGSEKGIAAQA